jgi:hypothetical protein
VSTFISPLQWNVHLFWPRAARLQPHATASRGGCHPARLRCGDAAHAPRSRAAGEVRKFSPEMDMLQQRW